MRDLVLIVAIAALVSAMCATVGALKLAVQLPAVAGITALVVGAALLHRAREFSREIQHRRQAEAALRESEHRYRELFENAHDMVYTHDLEGRLTSLNMAGERLTGYTSREALGITIGQLIAPSYRQRARDLIDQSVRGQSVAPVELEIIAKQGRSLPVEVSVRPIAIDGKPVAIQGIARDVTERRRFERQLVHLASHDALTGLFNRRRFEDELQLQLSRARRTASPGALLFLDLDHFKDVNDSLGHSAGDELLAEVAALLREQLQEVGTIARLGGDEFTVILPQTEPDQARTIADQAVARLRASAFKVAGQTFSVTGSVGIALIPPQGTLTAEELLSQADLAMYQAKEDGRNRVCVYTAETDWQAQTESRLRWRKRIWDALERNGFVMHAQPILDLRRNSISQYELLLRMRSDPGDGLVADAIIDNAVRFGFIQAIDRWVVLQGIQLLEEYGAGQDLVLELNLSSNALGDGELLRTIQQRLQTTPVRPENLVLEVTEREAIANIDQARQFVTQLKAIGCRFALDDFGVGFSSFHQLKSLDVDYLKIDGSFIRDLPRDAVDQHLVRAMVEMAKALGKETIAEFASDDETLDLLRTLGVDYAQGYHIGEPGPVEEVLLARRSTEASEAA